MFVDVYGEMGLDFVFVDTEHTGYSPLDSPMLQQFARAADVAETEILVRMASGDPSTVRKVLDSGIRNILVPRVETADDVRTAVKAARFTYDDAAGERGVGGSYPNVWGADFENYPTRQDNTVFVGALIENKHAVANIEEILSVPELGCVFLGPADLSVSYGHPLETDHPDVREALDHVWEAALAADVPIGTFVSTADDATDAVERGAQLVQLGDEFAATRSVLGSRLEEIHADR
ncbi:MULTISPECIES: HpcH/HpaI aldolase/citrate lyase family protein [Haloferax]|uniref:Aldolase n=2 Tax=Haloferax TaxID=2251 RepID=A0A6G1Z5Y0_9EURY|nr:MULTISPECIES: aldolase/citrate lyase family protein [Haloferax]KAB1185324.1 aldolase [Haloferax sp. CBA1149]MRW81960.1 aldolase [Haloferax marinisediminis]